MYAFDRNKVLKILNTLPKRFYHHSKVPFLQSSSNQCSINFENNLIRIEKHHSEYKSTNNNNITIEKDIVLTLNNQGESTISIFENDQFLRSINIEYDQEFHSSPPLYLHLTIKKLPNELILMEGILSDSSTHHGRPYQDSQCQGLKFQPFFLPSQNEKNLEFVGKGLIKRGIHSKGFPTPPNINSVCTCDHCLKSFTLKHFNSSQPRIDCFYGSGNRTLVASTGKLGKTPDEIDEKLKQTGWGDFSYFNPLKCPHCSSNFIDFEQKKSLKEDEIYGNYLINSNILYWKKLE